jgi:CheY-like chemotaxis protein
LLCGKRLFGVRGDEAATLGRSLELDVPPPDAVNPRVPRAVSDVVMRALARARDERYATGREMAQAIHAATGGLLYDEERAAVFMRELFTEYIDRTNHLLALTAQPGASDEVVTETGSGSRLAPLTGLATRNLDANTRTQTPAETPASGGALSWSAPLLAAASRADPAVVLAVDDSLVGRKLVEAHLSAAGFQVITCGSPAEALEVLAEMRPNLIVLDVIMAGMNGFELCKRIRETHPGPTPIIFVSAACSLAERTRGIQAGGDDFLRKPYDPAELVARVRAGLVRAAAMRELQGTHD